MEYYILLHITYWEYSVLGHTTVPTEHLNVPLMLLTVFKRKLYSNVLKTL